MAVLDWFWFMVMFGGGKEGEGRPPEGVPGLELDALGSG